ncbi:MAG: type III PLP-dependent enzyme [Gammaproteobacteria bacterium]|nr:type III PLP-dependent enzyme [Gammaproteobacteria bacterium]
MLENSPTVFDPSWDPFAPDAIHRLAQLYGSPLLIVDAERLRERYRRLADALPGVQLHFALKPLPHRAVVEVLRDEGASFDLATNGEVDLVRRAKVAPERCIHTHPIKRDGDIRTALAAGVDTFVVDNPDEVRKFAKYRGQAGLLIRVAFRNPGAVCDLSRKFGCDPGEVEDLIGLAASLDVRVRGLSFHVGSQAPDPAMHVEAIEACAGLIARSAANDLALEILDIGGGFPADYREPMMPIERFCAPIRAALAALPYGVRAIAEPGRTIVAPSAIGVSTVMGRAKRGDRWWYYLDDGLYGSYSGRLYDHANYPIEALNGGTQRVPSVLAGPTCDSIDVIEEDIALPLLAIGDRVVGRSMGAYTWASASDFNFFPKATVLVVDRGRLLDGSDEA